MAFWNKIDRSFADWSSAQVGHGFSAAYSSLHFALLWGGLDRVSSDKSSLNPAMKSSVARIKSRMKFAATYS